MHVASLKASYSAGQINSTVSVQDKLDRPVSGAAVQISLEQDGFPTIFRTGITSKFGLAVLSAKVPAGNRIACVEEIHKLGFEYDPLQNDCTSIQVS
jgi:hypothetical protein